MKQVIILKSRLSSLGGLERYALHLARAFRQANCLVTVLTSGPLPLIKEDFSIVSLHSPSLWGVLSVIKFQKACQKWLLQNPHDMVFSLDRTPNATYYRAGNGSHLSFLQSKYRSPFPFFLSLFNPKHQVLLHLEKRLFQSSKLKTLFTNSEMVKKELLTQYPLTPSSIKVVHNGVDFFRFQLSSKRLNSSITQLLFVGQDYKRKGLDLLLKALSRLSKPFFHLVVVGKDKNQKKYENWVNRLGLESKVTFKGPKKNVLKEYQEAEYLILPTHYDPFASVTLEALAMGLYVVTSSQNGAKEIIKENCGYILNSLESLDELTCILQKIVDKKILKCSKENIRASVRHLDLETQTRLMVDYALGKKEH